MTITATKLTHASVLRAACAMTLHEGQNARGVDISDLYKCEHSPIRTQIFWIDMFGIPTFVSTHLVRHKLGVEHFVESNRKDHGGGDDVGRDTPVNHGMLINAQALINMARKRLCLKADKQAVAVMREICTAIKDVDPELVPYLVPECDYRGGVCHELKPCGKCGEAVR